MFKNNIEVFMRVYTYRTVTSSTLPQVKPRRYQRTTSRICFMSCILHRNKIFMALGKHLRKSVEIELSRETSIGSYYLLFNLQTSNYKYVYKWLNIDVQENTCQVCKAYK